MKSGLNPELLAPEGVKKNTKRENKGRGQAQRRASQAHPSGIRAPRGSGLALASSATRRQPAACGRSRVQAGRARGLGWRQPRVRPGPASPQSDLPAPPERPERGGVWSRAASVATALPRLPRAGADAHRRGWAATGGPAGLGPASAAPDAEGRHGLE